MPKSLLGHNFLSMQLTRTERISDASGPSVEEVTAKILDVFDKDPLLTSQLTKRLNASLPGISCDVYGEAIATLLRDGYLRIAQGRYVRTALPRVAA
jgi:hypothetical protein